MKTDLITKGAAVKAILDWMDLHKSETIHKQDIAEIIMGLPVVKIGTMIIRQGEARMVDDE